MKKIHSRIISLLVCCYVSLFIATPIHAQSATLSISPPVVEILLAPNKQVKQTFTIHVEGEDVAVIPTLHRVKPSDNQGHSDIEPTPLSPSSIPLTVTSSLPLGLPHNLPPGNPDIAITLTLEAATLDIAEDVYLALVVQIVPQNTDFSTLSPTLPGISSLILTTINPTGVMPIDLEIQHFDLPYFHDTWLPFTVTPELKNSVDQMIHPEGKYEIITPTGKVIFSRDLYPSLVLGNSSREIRLKPEEGNLEPVALTFTPKWSNLGPHRVKLLISTQGGTKLTEVERVVWFLPIRLTIIIGSSILIVLALYLNKFRKPKLPIDTPPLTQ